MHLSAVACFVVFENSLLQSHHKIRKINEMMYGRVRVNTHWFKNESQGNSHCNKENQSKSRTANNRRSAAWISGGLAKTCARLGEAHGRGLWL